MTPPEPPIAPRSPASVSAPARPGPAPRHAGRARPPRAAFVAALAVLMAGATALAGCSSGQADPTPEFGTLWQGGNEPRLAAILGDPETSGRKSWAPAFDVAPTFYDFDGDGKQEILVHGNDTQVYVYSHTGRTLAVLPTKLPTGWYVQRVLNTVAAGVLGANEAPSVVVANHAAYVAAWRFEPDKSSAEKFTFTRSWQLRMDQCSEQPSMDAGAIVADGDGDGHGEVYLQTEEAGLFGLDGDGQLLWKHCWGGGNATPVAADLEGDGSTEIVFASDAGFVSVHEGKKGNVRWTFDAGANVYGVDPASISVSPTVAELDGLAPKEIVFTARHAPSPVPSTWNQSHMAIFAVGGTPGAAWTPRLLWMRQPEWANPLSYTRLIAKDADGDGRDEIFGMDWNTIGHNPGRWERLGASHVFRLDPDGNDVWVQEMDAWWSNKDIAVLDADGDGELDVLANGPRYSVDGLWRLSAATGEREGFLATYPWKVLRGPAVADIDGTGATLAIPVEPADSAKRGGIMLVALGVEG